MAFTIPTTKALAAQFLAAIEARINQTTPPVARAFNRVLSAALALFGSGVYKYITDRALQSFALTATGEGLDLIGTNYGLSREPAVAAVLEVGLVATTGTIIPVGTAFLSVSTGETYTTIAEVTAAADYALLNMIASTTGEEGNLALGEALAIGTPIVGANATAYVVASVTTDGIVTPGDYVESDTEYRRRVLDRIRQPGGGGNLADHRRWSEEVEDVARAFPYAGKPVTFFSTDDYVIADGGGGGPYTITYDGLDPLFDFSDLGFHEDATVTITGSAQVANNASWTVITVAAAVLTVDGPLTAQASEEITLINESLPGDRTVYVESESAPDVCPPATLDDVRSHLLTDPDTGVSRMPLGLVDERLYVESTRRVSVVVTITGLDVPVSIEAETKAKVEAALEGYLERICCFVEGLDFTGDRTDVISKASLSTVIQGILRGVGGSIDDVAFTVDLVAVDSYRLSQGELAELAAGSPVWA